MDRRSAVLVQCRGIAMPELRLGAVLEHGVRVHGPYWGASCRARGHQRARLSPSVRLPKGASTPGGLGRRRYFQRTLGPGLQAYGPIVAS